jgi:hypothetical protein
VIARVRASSPQLIARTVQANFLRMIDGDPWLKDLRAVLSPSAG